MDEKNLDVNSILINKIGKQPTIEQYINELYLFITYINRGFIKGAFVIEDNNKKIIKMLNKHKLHNKTRFFLCRKIASFPAFTHEKFINPSQFLISSQKDRYISNSKEKNIPDPNIDDILFTIDHESGKVISEVKRIIKFYDFQIEKQSYVYIKLEEYRTIDCGESKKHWDKKKQRTKREINIKNNKTRKSNRREDETFSTNKAELRKSIYNKDISEMNSWLNINNINIKKDVCKKKIENWYRYMCSNKNLTNKNEINKMKQIKKRLEKICEDYNKSRFEFFIPSEIGNILYNNCLKSESPTNSLYRINKSNKSNKSNVIDLLKKRKNNKLGIPITDYDNSIRTFLDKNVKNIYSKWRKDWSRDNLKTK